MSAGVCLCRACLLGCVCVVHVWGVGVYIRVCVSGLFSSRFGQKFGFAYFHAFNKFEKCRSEFGQSSSNFIACNCQNYKGQQPLPVQSYSFLAVRVTWISLNTDHISHFIYKSLNTYFYCKERVRLNWGGLLSFAILTDVCCKV